MRGYLPNSPWIAPRGDPGRATFNPEGSDGSSPEFRVLGEWRSRLRSPFLPSGPVPCLARGRAETGWNGGEAGPGTRKHSWRRVEGWNDAGPKPGAGNRRSAEVTGPRVPRAWVAWVRALGFGRGRARLVILKSRLAHLRRRRPRS